MDLPDVPADRSIEVSPAPGNGPPLLAIYPRALSPQAIQNLREHFHSVFNGPGSLPPMCVLEEPVKVFQLVDGRWQPLSA
jgi:hypothetical protein